MNYPEGSVASNSSDTTPPPVGGLNLVTSIAALQATDALAAENVICFPDRVEMRSGASTHVTNFLNPVRGLWPYKGPSSTTLWATTDVGVYDVTSAGAVGASAIALTNGYTTTTTLATGAGNYLFVANGTDTMKQYDGAAWTAIAAFGGLNTQNVCALETYKQRMFLLEKNTLTLWYLAVNSIAGAATSYPLGAIFRKGGAVKAIGTWSLDAGTGPDDLLAVATTAGEVAIFSGTDPSSINTWSLKGVFEIGVPVGTNCLYKYGGDLIYLAENGAYPLSKALLSAAIDKSQQITFKIQPLFSTLVTNYGSNTGWQALALPDVPILLLNIPGTPSGTQLCMHAQSGAWSTFSGWQANCVARMGTQLYFGTATGVSKGLVGADDFGANIVATCMSGYVRFKYGGFKHVEAVQSIFQSNGQFSYTLGIANDFNRDPTTTTVTGSNLASLWGTGQWGTSLWSSSALLTKEWRVVPDISGIYKALYWQVSSKTAKVALLVTNFVYTPEQSKFG
jgi:hypothetical protein